MKGTKGYYVYLIKDQNRLVILNQEVEKENYLHLMNGNGGDENTLLYHCKMFCLGYLQGNFNKKSNIVNDYREFK